VREILDDFNRRVIEDRRQLLGGPPVVTEAPGVRTDSEREKLAQEDGSVRTDSCDEAAESPQSESRLRGREAGQAWSPFWGI
jgi:hypothetical protein